MDVHTPEQRRKNMQCIRGKDTKPELYIRKLLYAEGYRYRLYMKGIPGKPDMWIGKLNIAIFVHGCFWHRHPKCKLSYVPKTRTEFWEKKFQDNVNRDLIVKEELRRENRRCLIIWECTIRKMQKDVSYEIEVKNRIKDYVYSDQIYLEL